MQAPSSLSAWFDPESLNNEDDATLALPRRGRLTEAIRERCLDLLDRMVDCRDEAVHPHLMAQVVLAELDQALQDGDENCVDQCVQYMGRFYIHPDQNVLTDILDQMAESPFCGKDTFNRMLELARKTR